MRDIGVFDKQHHNKGSVFEFLSIQSYWKYIVIQTFQRIIHFSQVMFRNIYLDFLILVNFAAMIFVHWTNWANIF